MKQFRVTMLISKKGEKDVFAKHPIAAANKAFRAPRGYSWVDGVEHHCLQSSGMLSAAEAKVVDESGAVSWLHLYEWG